MELDRGGESILCFIGFGPVFGQNWWAQERAQMPRLEKRYINQRTLILDFVFKAPIGPRASADPRCGVGPLGGRGGTFFSLIAFR